jgi:hypothetical protein
MRKTAFGVGPSGKQKPEPVWSPSAQVPAKMLRELRRDFANTIAHSSGQPFRPARPPASSRS